MSLVPFRSVRDLLYAAESLDRPIDSLNLTRSFSIAILITISFLKKYNRNIHWMLIYIHSFSRELGYIFIFICSLLIFIYKTAAHWLTGLEVCRLRHLHLLQSRHLKWAKTSWRERFGGHWIETVRKNRIDENIDNADVVFFL